MKKARRSEVPPRVSGARVAVAMSGGVDSSVAAYLLQKDGFEVHGFFMRNWSPLTEIDNDCPWQEDFEDVRRVSRHLNIPYSTLNFEKEYKERVLNYFLAEYQAGRTPNPDVLCNREIKFDALLNYIKALGFDYLATGHYAKLKNGKLVRPKDINKDQTYFLCHLAPRQLKNVMFPLADLAKNEVRQIAKEAGLPNAPKKDSQGICFIGKIPVREFLKKNLNIKPGDVVSTDGKVLGQHEGVQLYTIGQRHISVAAKTRLYVAGKNTNTNTIIMGDEKSLYTKNLFFSDPIWHEDVPEFFEASVQVRYRSTLLPARVNKNGTIWLVEPARAVTPGQFVAFYSGPKLIGGAVLT